MEGVHTGAVPNEEFQSPFLSIEGWRPRTFKDRILRNRNYYSRALPPMCLPFVYLMSLRVTFFLALHLRIGILQVI